MSFINNFPHNGPSFPKLVSASPALILQEFGNIGTVLLGVPVALFLGLKRETIGKVRNYIVKQTKV